MKYGFDIHGVIDTRPDIILPMMKALVSDGHESHIITGIPLKYVEHNLIKIGCLKGSHYTHFFSIQDYCLENNVKQIPSPNRHPKFEAVPWNHAKATYCKKNNICLMLDDSEIYQNTFTTPFALFTTESYKSNE